VAPPLPSLASGSATVRSRVPADTEPRRCRRSSSESQDTDPALRHHHGQHAGGHSGGSSSGRSTALEKRGTPEGGTPEGGTPEGGTPEGGTPERGTPESGTRERGTPERGTPELSPVGSWLLTPVCWLTDQWSLKVN